MSEHDFQTLPVVAEYMASLMPAKCGTILEPTPGIGNLVAAVKDKGIVTAPNRYHDIDMKIRFDWAIMNPPFTPMELGYKFLSSVMERTDNIIALLPWFILINSQRRLEEIERYGLVSVTHLPRKAFPNSRIQCCVLEMRKGYIGTTEFKTFNWK